MQGEGEERAPQPRAKSRQGTVATYDAESRSGTVLLDDGTQLAFGREAFDAGGLRLLRLGQRLRIESDRAGAVTRVTLVTLP